MLLMLNSSNINNSPDRKNLSEQKPDYAGAAGISSLERKFTALDAINGYEKFEDSTEGLLDQRFTKKMGIIGSPNTYAPDQRNKLGALSD